MCLSFTVHRSVLEANYAMEAISRSAELDCGLLVNVSLGYGLFPGQLSVGMSTQQEEETNGDED